MTDKLFLEDAYLTNCEATVTALGAQGIELDRTVFYANSGGQPGDIGSLRTNDGRSVAIADTVKGGTGGILHVPAPEQPHLSVGDAVSAEIDWPRRHRHMRMHTCLHLLCSLIDAEITGAALGEAKGRIDFNLPDAAPDKQALGEALARLIAEDHPLTPTWITDEELAAQPDLVRTMTVRPPSGHGRVRLIGIAGVDLQPCGGTHVRSTGEIGAVAIGKIENKGRRNRRVNVRFED